MTSRSQRRGPAPGLGRALGAGLMLLATGPGVSASAAGELRVLLFESQDPVEVDGVRVVPEAGGLRVDGRPVGGSWRVPGPGPHRAGPHQVRGSLQVEHRGAGLRVINHVPVEAYVVATLGGEVYASWEPAALRAQAVATRSYALYQRARRSGRAFDLEAGTASQVYGGVPAEAHSLRQAAQDTRGEILTWRGEPVLAAFHSSSGGRTASAEEVWGRSLPYLRSLAVPHEDASPDTYWRAVIPGTKLGPALAALGLELGEISEARVAERTPSGRAARVEFRGSGGRGIVRARALRRVLGASLLRSTLFEIRNTTSELVFVGSGHGHGIGMSQWGAQAMARRGADYREILATFYPGTTLERRSE